MLMEMELDGELMVSEIFAHRGIFSADSSILVYMYIVYVYSIYSM